MGIRSSPLAPKRPNINDHLKINKSNASYQTESTICGACCSNSLLDLSLLSLASIRDKLELLSREISAIVDLFSSLSETPLKSSDVTEDHTQEIIINKSHPEKY